MPRLIPKGGRTPDWKSAPPPHPMEGRLVRATQTFNCEGVSFAEGSVWNVDTDLVRRIWAEYPLFFEIAHPPVPPR